MHPESCKETPNGVRYPQWEGGWQANLLDTISRSLANLPARTRCRVHAVLGGVCKVIG